MEGIREEFEEKNNRQKSEKIKKENKATTKTASALRTEISNIGHIYFLSLLFLPRGIFLGFQK